MLELRGIAKRLGQFALEEVSATIQSGEYFVLLGPSGAGKTVLLEIVAGLIEPDRGELRWAGADITRTPPERRGFAMAYQDYALFPHRTVAGNIGYGVTGTDRAARVREVAAKLRIEHLLPRAVGALSGGERQRVSLARALAIRPRMLLLDEPLAALDATARLALRRELKQMQQQTGTTFLHVTHDLEEAMALADRVGVLLDNRLRQVASPEELFRRPSDYQVAGFLGLSNVWPVRSAAAGACEVNGVTIRASAAEAGVRYVWIKPEEILLSRQPFDSSALNQFGVTVTDWEHRGSLLAVRVAHGQLTLMVLITHTSFEHLVIAPGAALYATFKSSAVHCF